MSDPPRPSRPHPSRKSQKRLDWFIFLVADCRPAFRAVRRPVYLTSQKWTQIEIGLVLTVRGLFALGQIPGGALVACRALRVAWSRRWRWTLIATSALVYATFPIFPAVLVAATLHAAASCVLGPASLRSAWASSAMPRSASACGRNARFASIGARCRRL